MQYPLGLSKSEIHLASTGVQIGDPLNGPGLKAIPTLVIWPLIYISLAHEPLDLIAKAVTSCLAILLDPQTWKRT